MTTTWLDSYKERIIACWTNICLHLVNVNSNRTKSAHAKIKRQLRTSGRNFEQYWSNIHLLLELQHTEIKALFEKSLTIVYQNFMLPKFNELRRLITIHAMTLVLSQLRRVVFIGVDVVACGRIIRRTPQYKKEMINQFHWSTLTIIDRNLTFC